MLTARTPFTGATVPEVFGSIFKADPDWSLLPATTPVSIRRMLRRCLQKDQSRRLQHIGDALLDIEEAASEDLVEAVPASVSPRLKRIAGLAAALALILTVGGVATIALRPPRFPRKRVSISAPRRPPIWCRWRSLRMVRA